MKKIIALLCLLVMISGCNNKEEIITPTNTEEVKIKIVNYDNNATRETQLVDYEETKFKYDDFTIMILGLYTKSLTNNMLENTNQYNYKLQTVVNGKKVNFDYSGVYLEDVLKNAEIDNFEKVMFTNKDGSTLTVSKSDIKNTYLIFQANGKNINEWGPAKVVVSTYEINTWLESIISITIK